MKLDYDLLREILLFVEDTADGERFLFAESIWSNNFSEHCSENVFNYHLKFLRDSDYVEVSETISSYIRDITPMGRIYLDSVRNKDIWEKTKTKIQPLGNVTLSVVTEVAKKLILESLGLK